MDGGRGERAQRATGLLSSAKDRAKRVAEEGSQRLSHVKARAQSLVVAAGGSCVGLPEAGRPSSGTEEASIQRLGALGFSAPAAQHALRRCGGDLEAAAAWLLDPGNADERMAAEAGAPFIAPSALRPAGSEFAALSALRPKSRDLGELAEDTAAEPRSDEALRTRLCELLPEDGPEAEECLRALSPEELREALACLEADAAGRGRGPAPVGTSVQDGDEFFIRLEPDGTRPPGLVLDPRSLRVAEVSPGSLAWAWNVANPECVVWPGDTVWEVNGVVDAAQISRILCQQTSRAGQDLMVALRRPRQPAAVAAFRGSCSPTGADFLLPQALRSQPLGPVGSPPLRQWVPAVARGGSRHGSGAGSEGLAEHTAHFGRVDASELKARLRDFEAGGAEDAPSTAAAPPVAAEEALGATGPSAPRAAAEPGRPGGEAEPEAEETLAEAAPSATVPAQALPYTFDVAAAARRDNPECFVASAARAAAAADGTAAAAASAAEAEAVAGQPEAAAVAEEPCPPPTLRDLQAAPQPPQGGDPLEPTFRDLAAMPQAPQGGDQLAAAAAAAPAGSPPPALQGGEAAAGEAEAATGEAEAGTGDARAPAAEEGPHPAPSLGDLRITPQVSQGGEPRSPQGGEPPLAAAAAAPVGGPPPAVAEAEAAGGEAEAVAAEAEARAAAVEDEALLPPYEKTSPADDAPGRSARAEALPAGAPEKITHEEDPSCILVDSATTNPSENPHR